MTKDIKELAAWAQVLMLGLPGPRLDAVARELVTDLKVGGVILFARNIEEPRQVWELCRSLQELSLTATGQPLFIAVDQEGGPVQRLKAPLTLIPSARSLGGSATPEQVRRLATQVGRELARLGVNVNLAPVLDVAREPECPLWERSYSSDPEQAAAMGVAAIQGYLAGGVIPVGKHFPGLGDTKRDSHVELPQVLSNDPERREDLWPFQRAVAAGVPMLMTAHVTVPAWDSFPATLSAVAIQERLRRGLGFEGVVITDDLEMGAIAQQATVPAAALQTLRAGADLLLICQDYQAAWHTAALLKEQAPPQRLKEAAARLQRLRTGLAQPTPDVREIKNFVRG
jgi:beta-N-acetylhexosaminidase